MVKSYKSSLNQVEKKFSEKLVSGEDANEEREELIQHLLSEGWTQDDAEIYVIDTERLAFSWQEILETTKLHKS